MQPAKFFPWLAPLVAMTLPPAVSVRKNFLEMSGGEMQDYYRALQLLNSGSRWTYAFTDWVGFAEQYEAADAWNNMEFLVLNRIYLAAVESALQALVPGEPTGSPARTTRGRSLPQTLAASRSSPSSLTRPAPV